MPVIVIAARTRSAEPQHEKAVSSGGEQQLRTAREQFLEVCVMPTYKCFPEDSPVDGMIQYIADKIWHDGELTSDRHLLKTHFQKADRDGSKASTGKNSTAPSTAQAST